LSQILKGIGIIAAFVVAWGLWMLVGDTTSPAQVVAMTVLGVIAGAVALYIGMRDA